MVVPNVRQRALEFVESSAQAFRSRNQGPGIALPTAVHPGRIGERIETSVQQLLAILARRHRMIAATAVCGTVLLMLAAWWISPTYTALAQIGVISPAGHTTAAAWSDPRASQMMVDTHMVMLKSRDFLREVLVSLDEGVGAARPMQGRELDRRLEAFERRVSISQSLSSSVISIRYSSNDPDGAANAVNQMVTLYRARLRKREADSLGAELDRLGQRIAEIDRAGKAARAQIQAHLLELSRAAPDAAADSKEQLARLEKDARANAQLQVELLRRQMEVRQRLEAPTQGVWVVSMAAVPVTPSSLPRWLLIVPGAVLLVIGSCFWAIASEQLRQGLHDPGDVAAALSLPCAGLVPRGPHIRSRGPRKQLSEEPFAPYTESIRSIAAALGVAAPCQSAAIVLLSRSEPGEGSTTLAVGIAQYAASIGRRVLLVDLDVRTPGVLRELGLEASHDVGDLVLNGAAPEAVIRTHPALAFDYLPTKPGRIDPLSLIASGKLHAALLAFRSGYDLVILDGPPALRPEAPLLAAMADKVLFVVKWGSTRREVAQDAVRMLCGPDPARHDPTDFMAAVVTQVPTEARARYPFADAVEIIAGIGRRLITRCGSGSRLGGALKRFRIRGAWVGQEGQ